MHPYEAEIKDSDAERIWKKVFRKVDCDYCNQDSGICGYGLNGWELSYMKCPKWEEPFANCMLTFTYTSVVDTTTTDLLTLDSSFSLISFNTRGIVFGT